MVRRLLVLALLAGDGMASGQGKNDAVKQWIAANQAAVMQEFVQLVSIPDVKTDKPNIERNAKFLKAMLTRHGFATQVWMTPGSPMVYGEHKVFGRNPNAGAAAGHEIGVV
jgi:acetylornithine deacetylase/succinyl-diaminopimelate desuccinylase-like protein